MSVERDERELKEMTPEADAAAPENFGGVGDAGVRAPTAQVQAGDDATDPATPDTLEDETVIEAETDVDEEEEEEPVFIYEADAEDRAEAAAALLRAQTGDFAEAGDTAEGDDEIAPGGGVRDMAELMAIIEGLIFVSDDPLTAKSIADVLKEEKGWIEVAVEALAKEFNERNGGLMLREVAGGWQFATRPEHHEHVRAFLKSRPSAKLSLAALETLAVIAYKQPVTVPEILEIRGVQSSSAIKTLLDKRLIIAKGRKETVGRPMLYGTSKEFLLQFGLKDLTELPNVEDFEDMMSGGA
ncbi:MAG: SMC-Scp complex subunit ScpB [Pyrinomonadaceae bacterium]